MSAKPLQNYMEFAAETAYLAGRLTLGYYQSSLPVEFKPDDTPVTAADRAAEELICSRIEKNFPDHSILGEEFGSRCGSGNTHRWIIDPIDGTKSFMRGVPLYAVLIGLEIDSEALVGAAYFPALDEMICAAAGYGCWWNGRRAHVSTISDLTRAYLATTTVRNFAKYGRDAALERLASRCYYQTGWSDAYGYLLVATGRLEIMLDPIMSVWDCAPFPTIMAEAGGYFGDWNGNVTIYGNEGLAVNAALRSEVLGIINSQPD